MENESPTQGPVVDSGLPTEQPTATSVQTPTADATNQETISQEAVSDDSTAQTDISGADETDEGLAKYAKGQGITEEEFATLSEREKRLLKVAKDNQTAARNKPAEKGLTDINDTVIDAPQANETIDQETRRELRQYRYDRQTDQFWAEGNRDRSLEPEMVKILNTKVEELTPVLGEKEAKKYTFNLSRDLSTLYDMAAIKTGSYDPSIAREEGRREERDSMRRQAGASAPEAHATSTGVQTQKIDKTWLRDTYDFNNEEHRQLVAEAMARGDLYN